MTGLDRRQLEELLQGVSKPGRYLGNEWNVARKDLDAADVTFALAFPDIYDVGMSYLGLRIVYGVLNSREDVACERVFAPWIDMEGVLRERRIPLFSLESKVPVREFDIIGFSLTYELNYTNVLNMLDLAKLPLLSRERGDGHPLIIAGGPCAMNPAPLSEFIDAFVVGEGEEVILEIIDVYKKGKSKKSILRQSSGLMVSNAEPAKGKSEELLKALADIEGVYVPRFPREVKRRIVKDLNTSFYPTKELVPYVRIIHDRITLEIMRGCPFRCKFCQASHFYRPVRLRSPERILELVREIYRHTGYEEISLLSLSTGSYPGIVGLVSCLIDEYKEKGIGVSLPSLRSGDILAALPALIAKVRKTSLTFAIEAGSERLRAYINKDIDVEKVVRACDAAFQAGWRLVKLYFMIGLPTETAEDLEGIAEFAHRIRALKKDAQLSVSISTFVPKFGTPFAGRKMGSAEAIIEKQKFLRGRLKDRRIKVTCHDARVSILEGLMNRPDPSLAEVVFAAWKKGARFDSWRELFNFGAWQAALEESNVTCWGSLTSARLP